MKCSFFAATRVRFQRRLWALAAMPSRVLQKRQRCPAAVGIAWQRPSATVTCMCALFGEHPPVCSGCMYGKIHRSQPRPSSSTMCATALTATRRAFILSPTRLTAARHISLAGASDVDVREAVANKGASHESWHHSADRPDPDSGRRPAHVAARSQLGLRSQRHRRRHTDNRNRPVLAGAPVIPVSPDFVEGRSGPRNRNENERTRRECAEMCPPKSPFVFTL